MRTRRREGRYRNQAPCTTPITTISGPRSTTWPRGFHIDAVRRAEPGEAPPAAERLGSGLIEVSQHLDWRYEFQLTLDPVSNLNLVELRDPGAADLALVFFSKTGLMYGPLGEDSS